MGVSSGQVDIDLRKRQYIQLSSTESEQKKSGPAQTVEEQQCIEKYLTQQTKRRKGRWHRARMDSRKLYCEANSVVERTEPESSVDLDNDDEEDKLVIVEDPREDKVENSTERSSEASIVVSLPETSKKFRGPKKKFLEEFCRSEFSGTTSDSTTGSKVSFEKSIHLKAGSSINDDRNSMPLPDSNDDDFKVCDSTKSDDGSELLKKGVPMFNLRSCIDLIIDSRLIRERLNTSDDILNEQYNIKVSLSRVNERKTVRELAMSNKECKTLRNVLHQNISVMQDPEDVQTSSAKDIESKADTEGSAPLPDPVTDTVPPEPTPRQTTPVEQSVNIHPREEAPNSNQNDHNPLHQIAALASSLPKQPIAMATEADRLVTGCSSHSQVKAKAEYPASQKETAGHAMPPKKAMPPLIDTRLVTPPIIDVDNYSANQAPKIRTWPGPIEKPDDSQTYEKTVKTFNLPVSGHHEMYQNTSKSQGNYNRPQLHELAPQLSDRSWSVNSNVAGTSEHLDRYAKKRQQLPSHGIQVSSYDMYYPNSAPTEISAHPADHPRHSLDNADQRNMEGPHIYSSSGGQLVQPLTRSVSSSQHSSGVPSQSAGVWGGGQFIQQQTRVSPVDQHRLLHPQYSVNYPAAPTFQKSYESASSPHNKMYKQAHYQQSYMDHPRTNQDQSRESSRTSYSSSSANAGQSASQSIHMSAVNRDSWQRTEYEYKKLQQSPNNQAPLRPPPPLYGPVTSPSPITPGGCTPVRGLSPSTESLHSSKKNPDLSTSAAPPGNWMKSYPAKQSLPVSQKTRAVPPVPAAASEAPLDLTVKAKSSFPASTLFKEPSLLQAPPKDDSPLDLTVSKPNEQLQHPVGRYFSSSPLNTYPRHHNQSPIEQLSLGHSQSTSPVTVGIIPSAQPHTFAPVRLSQGSTSPQSNPPHPVPSAFQHGSAREARTTIDLTNDSPLTVSSLPLISIERPLIPSISRGVIDPDIEKQQTQALRQQQMQLQQHQQQQSPVQPLQSETQLQQQSQSLPLQSQAMQTQAQFQQQILQGGGRGQPKTSTSAQLLGNHPPNDILYLKCNVCTSTYGSLHSFRKHFWKVHGYGPTNEHVTVRSISATRGSSTKTEKAMDEIEKPVQAELVQGQVLSPSPMDSQSSSSTSSDTVDQSYDMVHMQVQRPCTLGEMNHKMAPLSDTSQPGSPIVDKATSPNPKSESNQSTMRCLQCGQDFPTRDWGVFRRHVRAHEQPTLKCTLCRQTFSCTRDLQEHNRTYHQDQMWICRVCGVAFISPGDLGKHMKVIHHSEASADGDFKCQICLSSNDSVQQLLSHLTEHKDQPELAARYASQLVTSANIRRASPDSTNDVEGDSPEAVESKASSDDKKNDTKAAVVLPHEAPDNKSTEDKDPSCSTSNSSGKQSAVLKLPKKALYDFIKDKVEMEARRQLGEFHAKTCSGSTDVVQTDEFSSHSSTPSDTQPKTEGSEETEAKGPAPKDRLESPAVLAKPSEGVSASDTGTIPSSNESLSKAPFKTVRDALHMLVERAVVSNSVTDEDTDTVQDSSISIPLEPEATDPKSLDNILVSEPQTQNQDCSEENDNVHPGTPLTQNQDCSEENDSVHQSSSGERNKTESDTRQDSSNQDELQNRKEKESSCTPEVPAPNYQYDPETSVNKNEKTDSVQVMTEDPQVDKEKLKKTISDNSLDDVSQCSKSDINKFDEGDKCVGMEAKSDCRKRPPSREAPSEPAEGSSNIVVSPEKKLKLEGTKTD